MVGFFLELGLTKYVITESGKEGDEGGELLPSALEGDLQLHGTLETTRLRLEFKDK